MLLQIGLAEGAIDLAIEALRANPRAADDSSQGRDLTLDVARAAEAEYPLDASALYRREVEHLIARKRRDSYDEAVRLLRRIRDLSTRTGQTDAWNAYRAELDERYRTFRLLQDTLAAAGV